MTKGQEILDFLAMFPEVFVKELPEDIPPVRKILHRIILNDLTKLKKTPTFKAPQALMPKFKPGIDKELKAGIQQRSPVSRRVSMFLEAKPDVRICHLVDLRFRNDNTVADHC